MYGIKCMVCGEIVPIKFETIDYPYERFMNGERLGLPTDEIITDCPVCQTEYTIKSSKENIDKIKEKLEWA